MRRVLFALSAALLFSTGIEAQDKWDRIAGQFAEPVPVLGLWSGGYDKPICEVIVGYVNKSWVDTYSTGTVREDFFGDEGKFLHGIQFGALFTPSFDWGLGARTGVFFEGYSSTSPIVRDFGWDNYGEVDLYIPAHASFRIPFDENSALSLYGGIGFQLAMSGKYHKAIFTGPIVWWRRPVRWGYSEKQEFGYGWPQRVNWQAECGFNLRIRHFAVNFTYSFGLSDQGIQNSFDDGFSFETAKPSRQDKIQAGIAFVF